MNILNMPPIATAFTESICGGTLLTARPAANEHRRPSALDRHRAEFAAVPKEALIEITIDVSDAMFQINAYSGRWAPYWTRIATLPEVDVAQLEAIPSLAHATFQAHTAYLCSTEPGSNLFQTLTNAIAVRDALLFDARVMLRRGLLPVASLDGIVRQQGYRQVAAELHVLVSLLQEYWQNVKGKVNTTPYQLQQAALLVHALCSEDRVRPKRTWGEASAVLLRKQAFTVTVRAYNEMRRCLRFLTRRRQIDELAPSLYKGRGGRKRKVTTAPVELNPRQSA